MSYKAGSYAKEEEDDEMGSLADRLALDLRASIRKLGNFPVLSPAWLEMAEAFGRIASISEMESSLPMAKKDATLWETDEQALRFLLEDGKLNLSLRNMTEFKQYQRTLRAPAMAASDKRLAMSSKAAECDKFEKGLGQVLLNAWGHVEALQTTELPGLINHIADVLEGALEGGGAGGGEEKEGGEAKSDYSSGGGGGSSEGAATAARKDRGGEDAAGFGEWLSVLGRPDDLHARQEIVVILYLGCLMRHLEHIREERIMPLLRARGVFMLACRLLLQTHMFLGKALTLRNCVSALSLCVQTEDFSTYKSQYISTQAELQMLLQLKDECLTPLLADMDNRKHVRPLIDSINKAKRTMKK